MVDVLLSTYNGEKYLSVLLDSILAQTYQDFRLIIRDDGSNDSTTKILNEYLKKDSRIEIYCENNIGVVNSFFKLCTLSNSDYFMFADQDDFWLENKIEKELALIKAKEKNNEPILVYCDMKIVDDSLKTIDDSFLRNQHLKGNNLSTFSLLMQNKISGCAMIGNKKLISCLKFNNINNIVMHDYYLALIASIFGNVYLLNEPLLLYRQHSSNVLGAKKHNFLQGLGKSIKKIFTKELFLEENFRQAKEILDVYREEMSEAKIKELSQFISLSTKNILLFAFFFYLNR